MGVDGFVGGGEDEAEDFVEDFLGELEEWAEGRSHW